MATRKYSRKSLVRKLPSSLYREAHAIIRDRYTLLQTLPDGMNYQAQEKLINELFKKMFPNNTDIHDVTTKLIALNAFYSVHLYGISAMAQSIVHSIPTFDADVRSGSMKLVSTLAHSGDGKKVYRSFATKYCACHNPKAFPIYDEIVRTFLAKVIGKGNLPPYKDSMTGALEKMEESYDYYVGVYDAFRKKYHLTSLTYRQVDWYIWVANKTKNSANLSHLDLFKLIK